MRPNVRTNKILITGFIAVLACMAALVWIGLSHITAMETAWKTETQVREKVREAVLMRNAISQRTFSLAYVTTLEDFFERDEERLRFGEYAAEFIMARDRLRRLGLAPREHELLEKALSTIQSVQPAVERAMELAVEGTPPSALKPYMDRARHGQQEIIAELDRFVDDLELRSKVVQDEAGRAQETTHQSLAALTLLLFAFALTVSLYVVRREIWATRALYGEIADREQAESTVRKLNRGLEHRVAERTRELTAEISRREIYETRLRDSEARHRAVIETAADGILTINRAGLIQTVNPAAEGIFGYRANEIVGRPFDLLVQETDTADATSALARTARGPRNREIPGRRKDGTHFPLSLSVSEMQAGGADAYVAVARDISERKRAEHRTLIEKERAETYLDVAEALFLELDTEGRITRINRRCCDVTGCLGEDVRGQDWFACFVPEKDRDEARAAFATFVSGAMGTSRHVETTLRPRNGTDCHILWHDTLRHNASGDIVGTLASGQDVTEYRRQQEHLRHAVEDAELANRAKSEFLANMSHELRTPLNAIIGFSDLIRSRALGDFTQERYGEYLEDIHDSGRHLLQLVNDILDVAKVEAGQIEIHEETVEIGLIIESALRLVHPRAKERDIEITTAVENGLPNLRADARYLKQILLNLLTNAVKFSHPGGKVSVEALSAAERGVHIRVRDHGIGMFADEIPIALTPFRQLERGRFAKHEGTGLGLPLSVALIEAHGGHLILESEPGSGTTAIVCLPSERLVRAA